MATAGIEPIVAGTRRGGLDGDAMSRNGVLLLAAYMLFCAWPFVAHVGGMFCTGSSLIGGHTRQVLFSTQQEALVQHPHEASRRGGWRAFFASSEAVLSAVTVSQGLPSRAGVEGWQSAEHLKHRRCECPLADGGSRFLSAGAGIYLICWVCRFEG